MKRKLGRPLNTKNPTAHERIVRKVPRLYDALLRKAETGDASAVALCFDITKNPSKYPKPK